MAINGGFIAAACILLSAGQFVTGASIDRVTPSEGSLGGETRITIYGSGFSKDQFSQNNDPNKGNQVYLISDSSMQYECMVHRDGCTEKQVMCYTPQRMNEEAYYIKMKVDGTIIPDSSICKGNPKHVNCTYTPSSGVTPTIDSFSPRTGKKGIFITMRGKLFSDRYGSNIAAATNSKKQKLLRVYAGVQDCGLKNGDIFYGLQLDNATTNQGSMICLHKGTSVGSFNASFIVESPHGRSVGKPYIYHVGKDDTIYMFQIYTDITSITPKTGSTAGGLTLTVCGNDFDDRPPYKPVQVFIGGTTCTVTKNVTAGCVECKVAAQPAAKSGYKGNRGVTFEYWTGTSVSNVGDVLAMTSSNPGYNTKILDETWHENDTMDNYVSRMTTLFSPPHDGEYTFFLMADDGAKLYVDGVELITAGTDWTASSRRTLSKNSLYKLVVVHYETTVVSYVKLKVKFYNTKITKAMTGKAVQEQQKISITSTVVKEVQVLNFNGHDAVSSYTSEVQTVVIDTTGDFRFRLFGVVTEKITSLDEAVITNAIKNMPIWGADEGVTVARTTAPTPTFTITFSSKRGDFPSFEVIPVNQGSTVTATETTAGTPNKNDVAITMANVVSEPFQISTLTAAKLETVLDKMFGARCPSVFESKSTGKVYQSFESSSASFSGTIYKKTEPFCGRYVLKNPNRLYKKILFGISLDIYPTVCFAYKGLLHNYLYIKVSMLQKSDGLTVEKNIWSPFTFKTDSTEESDTWYYNCFDVGNIVKTKYPDDSMFTMNEFSVFRKDEKSDCFVDAFFVGKTSTTNDPEYNDIRLKPSKPNGFLINSVSVASTTTNQYTVTLSPFDCGNELPLFELGNGQVSSGRTSSPSTAATSALSNGLTTSMSVWRTQAASPPVTGTVQIQYNGSPSIPKGLNVSLTGDEVARVLGTISGIGNLYVTKTDNCANFDFDVTFWTNPGDQQEMTVESTNLMGISPAASISTVANGGLYYEPLMGDMLSTEHSTPQVHVLINGIPTSCTGDCSFTWNSAATPTVTSVTPSSGTSALGTSITISGTGFSNTASDNNVSIGGVACTATTSTPTSIICNVGNGPVGAHKIDINVAGKGSATHPSGDVTFSYTADISGISQTRGGLGGCTLLTITGHGFKSDAVVSINSNTCPQVSVIPGKIVCSIPVSSSSGTYDVVVVQGATRLSHSSYVYDSSLTPSITSVVPSSIAVIGATITISGSSLGTSGSVYLDTTMATVVSWSDNTVVIATGTVKAGQKDLKLMTSNGCGLSSGSWPKITAELYVSNVYPLQGSLLGGTYLTIAGSGFGTDSSKLDVSVGPVPCDISSVVNAKIVCEIGDAARVHKITNNGVHSSYGIYYAYDKPHVKAKVGETIEWKWSIPDFVNDVKFAIIEVDSPSSTTPKVGGINSGAPSETGTYSYRLTEPGTINIWSGFVDMYGIKNFYGIIEVDPAVSYSEIITVTRDSQEALYTLSGASTPVDSSSCKSVVTNKDGCTDALPPGVDSTRFNFAFYTCSTPIVTSISANNGTAVTPITLTGEGLSSNNCQNEVSIGEFSCEASSSTVTSVTCRMARSGEPKLGIMYPFSLRVGNRGNALFQIKRLEQQRFALLPVIESITPDSGSLAGGNTITITGFGFVGSPLVDIGGFACTVISSSYTEIVCDTPSSTSQTAADITVNAYAANGNPIPANCETSTRRCMYSYASIWTPVVSNINPSTMSGATTFTMTGYGLGTVAVDVAVTIGDATATVSSVADTTLEGNIQNIPAGINDVIVKLAGKGKASGSVTVTGEATISSLSPASGSIYGRTTVTISGTGFVVTKTTVSFGGSACDILSVSLSTVICVTSAHAAGSVSTAITSNGVTYPVQSFSYDTTATPTVSSVSPVSGLPGSSLTITGSNFGSGSPVVTLNDVPCAVSASSASSITCTLGNHATGSVPVSVYVEGLGASNTDVTFEYQLSIASINPTTGGTAGGQTVTIVGTGFDDTASVTVCGQPCSLVTVSSTQFVCKTPSNTAQTCDVAITLNGLTKTLTSAYTYDASVTPTVSAVTPARGGTGGGTTITITGSGFGSSVGSVGVTVDASTCAVSSVTNSQIVCVTGPHSGSIDTTVAVEVAGNGIAQESTSGVSAFSYIDVWSSTYTWGGGPVPQEGEFIIIPKGMTLLLDCNTARLDFLLIQGKLIFDEKDVELQSNIIMITDGGLLQVGTEAQPFQHKAIITLHGHHRSKELPIYGTKVLALRNGTLELHGIHVPVTWTKLAATANAGDSTIQLQQPVEWNVGDEIVIASTGHHHSQSENEKHTIAAISADKMTLTLASPLAAQHLGTEETFSGTLVEFRAEIGLLTHNVVVRGNQDPVWEGEIKACEGGFNTGEFDTQTCFQGRFGDEKGSDQFGAMILVHAPVKDTHAAQAKISNTEVTHAGQAFRLGRYPIHFHLNGDMSTSYVKNCGIHKTFNRAVNIHGVYNTLIERTVIYNIMGGAFFLEDGIEMGNTLQYNLAVFVRESSSLLNDDVTPASYWVTNPNNTIQHNAAAGGTHFGFWYRMHDHPDGPSFTTDVCPKNTPLAVFRNNTAHSMGWFGLWIFEEYFPKKGGCGGTEVEPAVFRSLIAWNCEKGAEAVNSGALQFVDFVLVQNKKAGYEGKLVLQSPHYTDDSPMIKDSLIVGKTTMIPSTTQGCTRGGVIFGYGAGFRVVNVRFVNFADSGCAAFRWTRIDGTCSIYCGGYTYHTEQIQFDNAPNVGVYAWNWEGMVQDRDGSLTGNAGWTVVPTDPSLPSTCASIESFSIGIPARMCPPQYKFHRFSCNKPLPDSLRGKTFLLTNQYGTSRVPFADKRLSHAQGWMGALLGGETYTFQFENAVQIKNISFIGQFDRFSASDYVFVKIPVLELPDRVSIDGGQTFIDATTGDIDPTAATDGDWEWDNVNSMMKFIVHGRRRSRRGGASMGTASVDRPYDFSSFKCFYDNCIPPPDPNTIPPASERPASFNYWKDTSMWNMTDDGFVTYHGGSYGLPKDYDNVKIEFGKWVVVDMTAISKLGTLLLEGVLEFMDTPGAVYEINADYIVIRGGRLIIGWPNDPFDGLASIILRGNISSPQFEAGDGPTLGSKAIGVFGGLDLFGKDVGVTWTYIATTATAGSNQIVLKEQVTWKAGDDIVISPTSYDAWETESFKIINIAADTRTLTLNNTLRYSHVASTETTTNGKVIEVAAAVGLLTRNIKVIGEDYSDLNKESYGARVVVGISSFNGNTYGGYARLSNVEFYHTGQEGFTESYDPRFSVAYVAAGNVDNVKPSFVSKCSFNNGFNTAIGAFGIGGLNITDNVVFGTVGHSVVTTSDTTSLLRNMVTLMIGTASYQDRKERDSFVSQAGILGIEATNLIMKDNLVSGSERIGYHVVPLDCSDTSGNYKNNKAFANMMNVVVLPTDSLPGSMTCAKITGFTAWKGLFYGIYYQNYVDLVVEDNVIIENMNGLFSMIIGSDSIAHQYVNSTITVHDTTFVGFTQSFDCTNDVAPKEDDNLDLASKAKPSDIPGGAMSGLLFPNFDSATNGIPTHPWRGTMSYPAISGLMIVSDVTFANFKSTCNGAYAITTNVANDDTQFPIEIRSTTMSNVEDDYAVYYHRSNVGKINSADCVDMACDGMKKALLKDLDGSFLGDIGSVIPQSEYEWDGNPQHGLGDYRIPKTMAPPGGTNKDVASNKGIIRNDNCIYVTAWNAYKCRDDINYQMMVIESMDEDTELRRLSPVAVLGDDYIDLINGPQDQGWCNGYTCRKRLSTFVSIVATGKEYKVYFTSVTPKHMRYRILHNKSTNGVTLSVWYSQSNRLDVFADDKYVEPSNMFTDSKGRTIMKQPTTANEFKPLVSDPSGTNYHDKDTGLISFTMRGISKIDVITQNTIVISFGLPPTNDFFGENLIENIAGFLNIPLTKVRFATVVSELTRRKRSTTTMTVQVELGNEALSTINSTISNSLDFDTLLRLAADLLVECQLGDPESSFNITGSCQSISVPSLDVTGSPIIYLTPTPHTLFFDTELQSEYEGVPLKTQPKIRAVDVNGLTIPNLGTAEYPWQLTASIRAGTGHPNAQLNGTVQINATDGWFNFEDLTISHMGTGYILDFNVTFPALAENFTIASTPFNVDGRPAKIGVASITAGDISQNSRFSVTLNLKDSITDDVISAIDWRDHTWAAEVSMLTSQYATLTGVLTSTFDPASGEALFPDLTVTGVGSYYLTFNVVSTPGDFNLTLAYLVEIVNPSHVGMTIEETYEVEVKFDYDFSAVLPSDDAKNQFTQNIISQFANTWTSSKMKFNSIRSGSILLVFTVTGSQVDVNATAFALCDSISNNTVYTYNGDNLVLAPYMMINNVSFYGVTCGEIPTSEDEPVLEIYLIVIIAVLALILLVAVGALLYWRCCLKAKRKTANVTSNIEHHHRINSNNGKMNRHMFGDSGDYILNTKFANKDMYLRSPSSLSQTRTEVQRVKVMQHTSPEPFNTVTRQESPLPFGSSLTHHQETPTPDDRTFTPVGNQ